jgi:undecaprenyl diphosphate synthase
VNNLNIPQHIAIIMDGNGRWAKKQNKPRIFGHKNGVKAVRSAVKTAAKLGVKSLTLFAFSSENVNRPQDEISALFELFLLALKNEINKLAKNNIKLTFIGDLSIFDTKLQDLMQTSHKKLANNTGLELVIALNYGGKWDIVQAAKKITGEITGGKIEQNLSLNYPIDLLIRTSGEMRISNFLLWQCAYAEFYFTNVLWPDFDEKEFILAIEDFNNRKRRFGGL